MCIYIYIYIHIYIYIRITISLFTTICYHRYSDGASVGVQLATNPFFRGGVFAAVGGVGDIGKVSENCKVYLIS